MSIHASVLCHFQNPKVSRLLGRHRWNLACIFCWYGDKTSMKQTWILAPAPHWATPNLARSGEITHPLSQSLSGRDKSWDKNVRLDFGVIWIWNWRYHCPNLSHDVQLVWCWILTSRLHGKVSLGSCCHCLHCYLISRNFYISIRPDWCAEALCPQRSACPQTKLVNAIFWKWMTWFWCTLAQVIHEARAWNDQHWQAEGLTDTQGRM